MPASPVALLALMMLACQPDPTPAGDSGGSTPTDSGQVDEECPHELVITWTTGGESFFRSRCTSCHSSALEERFGAPDYLNYDTLEGVTEAQHAIRQAALRDEVMPPGYPLEEEERLILESFLDCGLEQGD